MVDELEVCYDLNHLNGAKTPKRHFFSTKKKREDTKDTKLDVDGSLCSLCVFVLFVKIGRFGIHSKIEMMNEIVITLFLVE